MALLDVTRLATSDCESLARVTDETLVVRFQNEACSLALEELVGRHLKRVRTMAFSMVLDDATADDVAQEVFVRVIRSLPSFRRDAKFSSWLYRICWNVIQDTLRRSARNADGLTEDSLQALMSDEAPDEALVRDELNQQVEQALRRLSPSLRAAIVLTSLQGLSGEEAAALEGCSVGTMYWRLHEARQQLQQRLKKYVRDEC